MPEKEAGATDRNFAWVVLQEQSDGRGNGDTSSASRVKRKDLDVPFDIDALKKDIKTEFSPLLDHVAAVQLKVFANEQELRAGEPLEEDKMVQVILAGARREQPLRVTYPQRAGSSSLGPLALVV
mmetsp:Transcript_33281/g.78431  ORF Transcript_33281/g.78431 Transcript_33281/m.78431 type:complete len:125 (-) Transcript_33281:634-1008(-)